MDLISKIKLNTINDVKEFVRVASECDFDIIVSYHEIDIDGKSLLGMLSIDLEQILNVVSYGYDKDLEELLKKYKAE